LHTYTFLSFFGMNLWSRRSCSNHFFGNSLFFAGKLRKVTPLSLSFSVRVLQHGPNILAHNWINEFRIEKDSFSLWALHQFGLNDVTDMWPGLQGPFKMAAPSVELFTSFSLGSHPLQKLKQQWVTQLNVNFLLVMEKNTWFLEWPSPLRENFCKLMVSDDCYNPPNIFCSNTIGLNDWICHS